MADWQKIFELTDIRLLFYLKEKGAARYSELLKNVLESRSSLALSLNELQDLSLIQRKVKTSKPIQTENSLTEKGRRMTTLLDEMKELIKK